jgi:hypothetical protein
MSTALRTTVVTIFEDHAAALEAVAELKRAGFTDGQIGVAYHAEHAPAEAGENEKRSSGVASGTGIGMLAGASIGGLVVGSMVVPPLGALFTGLVGGGVVGGLLGALIGLGVPEDEARYYHDQLDQGHTLVTVNAEARYAEAREILLRHGGREAASPESRAGVGALP